MHSCYINYFLHATVGFCLKVMLLKRFPLMIIKKEEINVSLQSSCNVLIQFKARKKSIYNYFRPACISKKLKKVKVF